MPEYDPFEDPKPRRQTAKDVERAQRERDLADVLFLMSDPAGRRVAHRLLSQAMVFQPTYSPGDPHQTSFNEGRRTLGLWLLGEITTIAAAQYNQMMEEASNAHS